MRIRKVKPSLSWVRTNQIGSCSFFELLCNTISHYSSSTSSVRIKKVRPYLSWVRTNQTGSCSFFLSCFAILNFLIARLTSLLVENRGESYLDRWVMTVNPLPPWGLEGLNPVYPESGPIRSDPAHFFLLSCYAILNFVNYQTGKSVGQKQRGKLSRQASHDS